MKRTVIYLTLAAVLLFGACRSNKNVVTQEQMGNREVELPCAIFGQDSEEYFGGMAYQYELQGLTSGETKIINAEEFLLGMVQVVRVDVE
jgi:hypothetical protein